MKIKHLLLIILLIMLLYLDYLWYYYADKFFTLLWYITNIVLTFILLLNLYSYLNDKYNIDHKINEFLNRKL